MAAKKKVAAMKPLDQATLTALIKEAKAEFEQAEETFGEFDNIEDFHEMNHWHATVEWLESKQ